MKIFLTVLVIVLIVALIVLFFVYRQARSFQVQQAEQQRLMDANTQVFTMMAIDKKKMRLKESPFPPETFANAPFYAKLMKICVVRAKVGPRIMDLMCEPAIFDQIPLKTEIKVKASGGFIKEILKGAVLTEKELAKRKKAKEKAAKKAAKAAK